MPQTSSQVFTGNAVAAALAYVTAAALPDQTVGANTDFQIEVSGGTAPYTFAVTAGAFPAGITLDSTGRVHGSATAAGSYSVTVSVTDSGA
jgi:large repetitive protein